jgi:hypothetical protein
LTIFSRLAHRLLSLSLDCSPSRSFSSKDWTALDNDIFVSMSSAVSMQLRALSTKDKASQPKKEKLKRVSNDRRIQLIIFLCFPAVFSASNSATPVMTSTSRIAEIRPKNPIYRSRVTECRYPAIPDVSIVLTSMNHFPREEFSSNLKNCVDPRGFRWSARI